MLTANRHAQQPKSETLGLSASPQLPLHIKCVDVIDLAQITTFAAADDTLRRNWETVRPWIDGTHPQDVPYVQAHEARITAEELRLLLAAGQIEPTSAEAVKNTCNVFPVPELSKGRRRLIKHTVALNERFDKSTLIGVKLIRAQDLRATVHQGKYAIHLDFSAWFDQIPLSEEERPYHCFPFQGKWYRLTRLPMGQRQAVDVASTITDVLAAFPRPATVYITTYIDNIRFLGDSPQEVLEAALEFVRRAWAAGATINEVSRDRDAEAQLKELLVQKSEFLGVEFDYAHKLVRVGQKALRKLQLLYDAWHEQGNFTVQNLLALFGVLFFAMQVTRPPAAKRYYVLKEYSDVA